MYANYFMVTFVQFLLLNILTSFRFSMTLFTERLQLPGGRLDEECREIVGLVDKVIRFEFPVKIIQDMDQRYS